MMNYLTEEENGAFHLCFSCTSLFSRATSSIKCGMFRAHVGWSSLWSVCSAPNSNPWEMLGLSPAPGHGILLKPPNHNLPTHFSPQPNRPSTKAQEAGIVGPTFPRLPAFRVGRGWPQHLLISGLRPAQIKSISETERKKRSENRKALKKPERNRRPPLFSLQCQQAKRKHFQGDRSRLLVSNSD